MTEGQAGLQGPSVLGKGETLLQTTAITPSKKKIWKAHVLFYMLNPEQNYIWGMAATEFLHQENHYFHSVV